TSHVPPNERPWVKPDLRHFLPSCIPPLPPYVERRGPESTRWLRSGSRAQEHRERDKNGWAWRNPTGRVDCARAGSTDDETASEGVAKCRRLRRSCGSTIKPKRQRSTTCRFSRIQGSSASTGQMGRY